MHTPTVQLPDSRRRGDASCLESKKIEIRDAATRRFGADSYAATNWSDIAVDVGLVHTSLYHYFASKKHCLFAIMDEAIRRLHGPVSLAVTNHRRPLDAVLAILEEYFRLGELEIHRNRVLVAEHRLLAVEQKSAREEQARRAARSRVRSLEVEWAMLLVRAMEQGAIPEADPKLLTRALLGLYGSIWHWHRPDEKVPLCVAADFYLDRFRTILGDKSRKVQTMWPQR
jgi:AcrR family transcriptional regulator